MADLNQPNQIKAYFQTIADRHEEISHYYYGHVNRLQAGFKNEVKEAEYALYVEWPQKQYADNGGSITSKLRPSLSILRAINKQGYDQQDDTIEQCFEILDDVIIRMRRECFTNGHIFEISDMGIIDPVYHYLIDNCLGVRVTLPAGDWVTTAINTDKWTDLP